MDKLTYEICTWPKAAAYNIFIMEHIAKWANSAGLQDTRICEVYKRDINPDWESYFCTYITDHANSHEKGGNTTFVAIYLCLNDDESKHLLEKTKHLPQSKISYEIAQEMKDLGESKDKQKYLEGNPNVNTPTDNETDSKREQSEINN